jgi:hypothetical protein
MARRADWDTDEGFEILNGIFPIKIQEKFDFVG